MSILNVNQIQPVGGGNTITVAASDVSASGATITATSFVGPLTGAVTGNVTGNLTGNVTSSSTSTFSSGINVTGGRVLVGTTDAGSNGTADDLVVANNSSASDPAESQFVVALLVVRRFSFLMELVGRMSIVECLDMIILKTQCNSARMQRKDFV